MKPCRECQREVSEQAWACPWCGAPRPTLAHWDGHGFEYKSKATVMGWPLIHISFKYRSSSNLLGSATYGFRMRPVPAKGIIAVGQFACGVLTVSQFGVGIVSISQFTIAGFAVAQFAVAYSLVAQMGLYVHEGYGQLVRNIVELMGS